MSERAPVAIRRASSADARTIADIGARTFFDAFSRDMSTDDIREYIASAFAPERIATELADPASVFLLASAGGRTIGYARLAAGDAPACVRGPDPVELARIYLDQDVVGCGYGAALMSACIDAARAGGHRTLWLGVWEHNARAIAFYRKWHLREVGSHEFVVGSDTQTDVIMERPL